MRRIKFYEKVLSYDDALKVFGLTSLSGEDEDSLKKLYRNLSIKNHPDKGGSVEVMQDVNQAYELLKKNVGGASPKSSKIDWDEIYRRVEAEKRLCMEYFLSIYKPETFKDYFSDYIKEDFTVDLVSSDMEELNGKSKIRRNSSSTFHATVKIHNKDNTTFFEIVYMVSKQNTSGGLAYDGLDTDDIEFSCSVYTSIYHDKRSLKMGQSRWLGRKGKKAVIDPKEVFPSAKMKKIFSGEAKAKKAFKKADMVLALQRELEANIQTSGGDLTAFIYPFGKESKFYFAFYRLVMLKKAFWTFGNIQFTNKPSGKRFEFSAFAHVDENEEELEKVLNIVKEFKKQIEKRGLDPKADGEKVAELLIEYVNRFFPNK